MKVQKFEKKYSHGVKRKICATQKKIPYSSMLRAERAASTIQTKRLRRGEQTQNLYAYQCPDCNAYHLTHRAKYYKSAHLRVYCAPDEKLQQWITTGVM